jgi:hypothetical protein
MIRINSPEQPATPLFLFAFQQGAKKIHSRERILIYQENGFYLFIPYSEDVRRNIIRLNFGCVFLFQNGSKDIL